MSSPSTGIREHCPICGSETLIPSIVFEALPVLCNVLYPDPISARDAAQGSFVTTYCRACSHLFNAAFDENRVGYTQSYENSLHFSPRFVDFSEALATRLNDTYGLQGKTVIDIGCGKGDFLKRLCATSGAHGVGFDKSFEANRGDPVFGVEFVADWFDATYQDLRPDFVCCRHVLEHIALPVEFLRQLREHPGVSHDTIFYFEVPNALYTLRDLGIWDLIYEHFSYFTLRSLRTAFEQAGFKVLNAGTAFGEQYIFIEATIGVALRSQPSIDSTIEHLVSQFEKSYRIKIAHWRDFLAQRSPELTVVWGAGSKGVTFVNSVAGGDRIRALVDVNPFKQGRYAPRTGTVVVAPEALRDQSVHAVIVMNPLYRAEISKTITSLGLQSTIDTA